MKGPHTVDLRVAFVGRNEELATLAEALDAGDAITLVGTGGVGKSRLAIEAAEDGSDAPDARRSSSHSPGVAPELIADAIARALEVRDEQGLDVLEAIADGLTAEPRALLLDNCEDAGAAVAAVIERLQGIAGVPILATSRSRLVTEGERDPSRSAVRFARRRSVLRGTSAQRGGAGRHRRRRRAGGEPHRREPRRSCDRDRSRGRAPRIADGSRAGRRVDRSPAVSLSLDAEAANRATGRSITSWIGASRNSTNARRRCSRSPAGSPARSRKATLRRWPAAPNRRPARSNRSPHNR